MRTSFASRGGFVLARTPNHRHQRTRRRIATVIAVLGMAAASGLIGFLTGPDPRAAAATGPFSYIPSE
jgi:hypothetical protein